MSKMTPKSNKFISDMYMAINHGYAIRDIKVYYDASKWTKRDYVAEITVSSDWDSYDTKYLKERMREAGATNIIGCVRHAIARDYLDLAFDIKKSKMKELGIDIPKAV
jgi:hypothetical protein